MKLFGDMVLPHRLIACKLVSPIALPFVSGKVLRNQHSPDVNDFWHELDEK